MTKHKTRVYVSVPVDVLTREQAELLQAEVAGVLDPEKHEPVFNRAVFDAPEDVMRIMISQPMAGKTAEQIRAEREVLAARIEAAGYKYVDSIVDGPSNTPNTALWCLGASLQLMSYCGAVVFMKGWDASKWCRIEHAAALDYGIEVWTENDVPEAKP